MALVDEGLADGSIACPDPDASVSRLLALLDGLSVAAEVFGSVSRPAAALARRAIEASCDWPLVEEGALAPVTRPGEGSWTVCLGIWPLVEEGAPAPVTRPGERFVDGAGAS